MSAISAVQPRQRVARGVVINSFFFAGVGGLNLLKAFIVARFLSASQFGVWSILFLAAALITSLKQAMVGEKYIQQHEENQELAFQKAFTLELATGAISALATLALAPLLAVIYGRSELILPGMALSLTLIGVSLQAPIWIFYRNLEFARQRSFMAIDPITSFAVTVTLAVTGFGYWSLVIGAVAGSWAAGLAALRACPYPLTLQYDRHTLRSYVSFSWPLVVAVLAGLLIAQLSVLFGTIVLGLAGAGAIGLAASYQAYADRLDAVITEALYPAVCRAADRVDLLFEVFTKSNRLALMWGFPFGIGLTLFAGDLVRFGIGEKWAYAITLFQVFGAVAAVNHIGFNWNAFYRARGETRPVAIVTTVALVVFCAAAIPLLYVDGLEGFAIGVAVMAAVSLSLRAYFLLRLFPGFPIASHTARAIAPVVPAVGAVLLERLVGPTDRTIVTALVELSTYVVVTVLATAVFERELIREAVSYVRRAPVVHA